MWPSIADRVPAQSDPEINAQLHEGVQGTDRRLRGREEAQSQREEPGRRRDLGCRGLTRLRLRWPHWRADGETPILATKAHAKD